MTIPYQPHLVANQRTAIDLSMDQWLTPQDAYQSIQDGFQFRGVVNKRNGYSWFDQIPHAFQGSSGNEYQNISNITLVVGATITTHGSHGLTAGQLIRITDVTGISPGSAGAPINGTRWTVVTTPTADTFTINNTGAFGGSYGSDTGTLSTFPGLSTMCISNWVDPTNNSPNLIVLDTKRAAIYDSTQMCLKPIGYTDQFTGTNTQLFWWENYRGAIYYTNNHDNIFYWNGTQLAYGLTTFTPQIVSSDDTALVNNCLMIKAINNRLVLYNTNETIDSSTSNYPTRVRWCQPGVDPSVGGDPPTSPDLGGTAWFQDTPGMGGAAFDLTDSLYIISQAQIQTNNLIFSQNQQFSVVYEQRSTADLQRPFAFVKIATSRNINSTFGTVILDREVQLVGNTGLILTDGNSVGRYDDKIPDFAIDIISQNNFQNAFGVRDDIYWQSWLLFTSNESSNGLNDKILVYNYQDRGFQYYNISLCCAGLFSNPGLDPEWTSYGSVLPDYDWTDFGEQTWITLPQQASPMLLGGGYDGNIWWMDQGGGDAADNVAYGGVVPSGYVSEGNPITMTLVTRQWFPYAREGMASQFGYIDFLIDGDPTTIVSVSFNVDNETSDYLNTYFTCVNFENIEYSTIENITQSDPAIVTSEDHGLITNQTIYIFAVQGMTQLNNSFYTITVIDQNTISLNGIDSSGFSPYTGGGVITLDGITQNTFWTRVWSGQTGVFHQMTLVAEGPNENFRLHASIPWFKPTGRIYKG